MSAGTGFHRVELSEKQYEFSHIANAKLGLLAKRKKGKKKDQREKQYEKNYHFYDENK